MAPPSEVAAATSGSALFTFLGYFAAPALFAGLVSISGSWSLPFALVARQLAIVALLVATALRRIAGAAGLRR